MLSSMRSPEDRRRTTGRSWAFRTERRRDQRRHSAFPRGKILFEHSTILVPRGGTGPAVLQSRSASTAISTIPEPSLLAPRPLALGARSEGGDQPHRVRRQAIRRRGPVNLSELDSPCSGFPPYPQPDQPTVRQIVEIKAPLSVSHPLTPLVGPGAVPLQLAGRPPRGCWTASSNPLPPTGLNLIPYTVWRCRYEH